MKKRRPNFSFFFFFLFVNIVQNLVCNVTSEIEFFNCLELEEDVTIFLNTYIILQEFDAKPYYRKLIGNNNTIRIPFGISFEILHDFDIQNLNVIDIGSIIVATTWESTLLFENVNFLDIQGGKSAIKDSSDGNVTYYFYNTSFFGSSGAIGIHIRTTVKKIFFEGGFFDSQLTTVVSIEPKNKEISIGLISTNSKDLDCSLVKIQATGSNVTLNKIEAIGDSFQTIVGVLDATNVQINEMIISNQKDSQKASVHVHNGYVGQITINNFVIPAFNSTGILLEGSTKAIINGTFILTNEAIGVKLNSHSIVTLETDCTHNVGNTETKCVSLELVDGLTITSKSSFNYANENNHDIYIVEGGRIDGIKQSALKITGGHPKISGYDLLFPDLDDLMQFPVLSISDNNPIFNSKIIFQSVGENSTALIVSNSNVIFEKIEFIETSLINENAKGIEIFSGSPHFSKVSFNSQNRVKSNLIEINGGNPVFENVNFQDLGMYSNGFFVNSPTSNIKIGVNCQSDIDGVCVNLVDFNTLTITNGTFLTSLDDVQFSYSGSGLTTKSGETKIIIESGEMYFSNVYFSNVVDNSIGIQMKGTSNIEFSNNPFFNISAGGVGIEISSPYASLVSNSQPKMNIQSGGIGVNVIDFSSVSVISLKQSKIFGIGIATNSEQIDKILKVGGESNTIYSGGSYVYVNSSVAVKINGGSPCNTLEQNSSCAVLDNPGAVLLMNSYTPLFSGGASVIVKSAQSILVEKSISPILIQCSQSSHPYNFAEITNIKYNTSLEIRASNNDVFLTGECTFDNIPSGIIGLQVFSQGKINTFIEELSFSSIYGIGIYVHEYSSTSFQNINIDSVETGGIGILVNSLPYVEEEVKVKLNISVASVLSGGIAVQVFGDEFLNGEYGVEINGVISEISSGGIGAFLSDEISRVIFNSISFNTKIGGSSIRVFSAKNIFLKNVIFEGESDYDIYFETSAKMASLSFENYSIKIQDTSARFFGDIEFSSLFHSTGFLMGSNNNINQIVINGRINFPNKKYSTGVLIDDTFRGKVNLTSIFADYSEYSTVLKACGNKISEIVLGDILINNLFSSFENKGYGVYIDGPSFVSFRNTISITNFSSYSTGILVSQSNVSFLKNVYLPSCKTTSYFGTCSRENSGFFKVFNEATLSVHIIGNEEGEFTGTALEAHGGHTKLILDYGESYELENGRGIWMRGLNASVNVEYLSTTTPHSFFTPFFIDQAKFIKIRESSVIHVKDGFSTIVCGEFADVYGDYFALSIGGRAVATSFIKIEGVCKFGNSYTNSRGGYIENNIEGGTLNFYYEIVTKGRLYGKSIGVSLNGSNVIMTKVKLEIMNEEAIGVKISKGKLIFLNFANIIVRNGGFGVKCLVVGDCLSITTSNITIIESGTGIGIFEGSTFSMNDCDLVARGTGKMNLFYFDSRKDFVIKLNRFYLDREANIMKVNFANSIDFTQNSIHLSSGEFSFILCEDLSGETFGNFGGTTKYSVLSIKSNTFENRNDWKATMNGCTFNGTGSQRAILVGGENGTIEINRFSFRKMKKEHHEFMPIIDIGDVLKGIEFNNVDFGELGRNRFGLTLSYNIFNVKFNQCTVECIACFFVKPFLGGYDLLEFENSIIKVTGTQNHYDGAYSNLIKNQEDMKKSSSIILRENQLTLDFMGDLKLIGGGSYQTFYNLWLENNVLDLIPFAKGGDVFSILSFFSFVDTNVKMKGNLFEVNHDFNLEQIAGNIKFEKLFISEILGKTVGEKMEIISNNFTVKDVNPRDYQKIRSHIDVEQVFKGFSKNESLFHSNLFFGCYDVSFSNCIEYDETDDIDDDFDDKGDDIDDDIDDDFDDDFDGDSDDKDDKDDNSDTGGGNNQALVGELMAIFGSLFGAAIVLVIIVVITLIICYFFCRPKKRADVMKKELNEITVNDASVEKNLNTEKKKTEKKTISQQNQVLPLLQ